MHATFSLWFCVLRCVASCVLGCVFVVAVWQFRLQNASPRFQIAHGPVFGFCVCAGLWVIVKGLFFPWMFHKCCCFHTKEEQYEMVLNRNLSTSHVEFVICSTRDRHLPQVTVSTGFFESSLQWIFCFPDFGVIEWKSTPISREYYEIPIGRRLRNIRSHAGTLPYLYIYIQNIYIYIYNMLWSYYLVQVWGF